MAEKKKRTIKKVETVRERTARKSEAPAKKTTRRRVVSAAKKPLVGASRAGRKEHHIFKLPDNKLGRFLGRRAHIMPKYFRNAWAEVKQVEWPNRKETTKLTFAVIVFALVFGALVYLLDLGLNKIFREILLG